MKKVTVIGSGNVGFHLINLLQNSKKIQLHEWYSRSLVNDKRVNIINEIKNLNDADIYIICVNDNMIERISNNLPFKDKLVLHTSGSLSYDKIDSKNRRGVFYPLQTFSKSLELNYSEIPICIEAEFKYDLEIVKKLSKDIGCKFYQMDFNQRKTLHLAAIIANNFTNFLIGISKELVESEKIDFNILKPLIKETFNKIHKLDPIEAQTGPARRHDINILKVHQNMIKDKNHKRLYKLVSDMIINKYGNKL